MAEIFPTPQSAVAAMTTAGWEVRPADELVGVTTGCIAALQGMQTDDGDVVCTPTLVNVNRAPDARYQLTGRMSGHKVDGWACAPDSTIANPVPLLLWADADIEVIDSDDPRAQDRVHDGMPADPFGDDPGRAAVATDAIELKTMLDTYIDAGFTRAEAFELILAHHQTELDHAAQHCIVHHQHQYEQGGDQ